MPDLTASATACMGFKKGLCSEVCEKGRTFTNVAVQGVDDDSNPGRRLWRSHFAIIEVLVQDEVSS